MSEPGPNQESSDHSDLIIAGIDVPAALRRTLDNRPLFMQMLMRFRDDHADSVGWIRRALEQNDRPLAERLAHTLKGVAGLIGATVIAEQAELLEEKINAGVGANLLTELLGQIDVEMQALQKVLSHVLPVEPPENKDAPSKGVDKEAAGNLILHLARLLSEYDGAAIELLLESEPLLIEALGGVAHQKIAHAARQFDFDAGLDALIESAESAGYKVL